MLSLVYLNRQRWLLSNILSFLFNNDNEAAHVVPMHHTSSQLFTGTIVVEGGMIGALPPGELYLCL